MRCWLLPNGRIFPAVAGDSLRWAAVLHLHFSRCPHVGATLAFPVAPRTHSLSERKAAHSGDTRLTARCRRSAHPQGRYANIYDMNWLTKGNCMIAPGVERVDTIKTDSGYGDNESAAALNIRAAASDTLHRSMALSLPTIMAESLSIIVAARCLDPKIVSAVFTYRISANPMPFSFSAPAVKSIRTAHLQVQAAPKTDCVRPTACRSQHCRRYS